MAVRVTAFAPDGRIVGLPKELVVSNAIAADFGEHFWCNLKGHEAPVPTTQQ
jgi:hypothetical protein